MCLQGEWIGDYRGFYGLSLTRDDLVVAFFVPPLEWIELCLPVLIFSPVMSRSCLQWCNFEAVFIVLSDLPDQVSIFFSPQQLS